MVATKKLYRVVKQFHYPSNPDAIAQIEAGRKPAWGQRRMRTVEAGDTLADLPDAVITSALRKGWLEEVARGG